MLICREREGNQKIMGKGGKDCGEKKKQRIRWIQFQVRLSTDQRRKKDHGSRTFLLNRCEGGLLGTQFWRRKMRASVEKRECECEYMSAGDCEGKCD